MNEPIYIAFDNADASLGHFFQTCADEIRQIAVDNGMSYKFFGADCLTKELVNSHTDNAEEYVFCAFSHGVDNALLCKGKSYIETNDNVCNFYSSVFFTFACYTANGIGKEFSDAYVLGYFGYNNKAFVCLGYEDVFVKCAISGIVSYIKGNNLEQAKQDMISEYDRQIKNGKLNLVYSCLLKNKQALVSIINSGDKTIK